MANKKNTKKEEDNINQTEQELEELREAEEDDTTYNMGEIVFDGDETDEEKAILSTSSGAKSDEDEDEEGSNEQWVGDDDYSFDDADPFLDQASFDFEDSVFE